MKTYEYDPSVPFWRGHIDAAALYAKYVQEPSGLSKELSLDHDYPEMRGRFEPLLSNTRVHSWTFTPGAGDHRAFVVPIYDSEMIVDILAVANESVWGCVTGRGQSAGNADTGRVYKNAWQWALFGRDGALVLDKSFYPSLTIGKQLLAEDLDHADELAYRVFSLPAFEKSGSDAADAAELMARDLVGVDGDRYDLELEIRRRTICAAEMKLKSKGIIRNGDRFAARG